MRDLRGEGVDTRAIVDPTAPTGLMLKESSRGSATSVFYYRRDSASSHLSPVDIDRLDIENSNLPHVTGITLGLSGTAREALNHAVDRARSAGVTVSFDVNHRSRLWSVEEAVSQYRGLVAKVDVVFGGDDELRLLVDIDDDDDDHSLHYIAITRMTFHPGTKAYVDRRIAEGRSRREVRRCIKRYLARHLYRTLNTLYEKTPTPDLSLTPTID